MLVCGCMSIVDVTNRLGHLFVLALLLFNSESFQEVQHLDGSQHTHLRMGDVYRVKKK